MAKDKNTTSASCCVTSSDEEAAERGACCSKEKKAAGCCAPVKAISGLESGLNRSGLEAKCCSTASSKKQNDEGPDFDLPDLNINEWAGMTHCLLHMEYMILTSNRVIQNLRGEDVVTKPSSLAKEFLRVEDCNRTTSPQSLLPSGACNSFPLTITITILL
jgi:hypothetical protein